MASKNPNSHLTSISFKPLHNLKPLRLLAPPPAHFIPQKLHRLHKKLIFANFNSPLAKILRQLTHVSINCPQSLSNHQNQAQKPSFGDKINEHRKTAQKPQKSRPQSEIVDVKEKVHHAESNFECEGGQKHKNREFSHKFVIYENIFAREFFVDILEALKNLNQARLIHDCGENVDDHHEGLKVDDYETDDLRQWRHAGAFVLKCDNGVVHDEVISEGVGGAREEAKNIPKWRKIEYLLGNKVGEGVRNETEELWGEEKGADGGEGRCGRRRLLWMN